MASQRLPLAVPIISRDGTLSKGSKMVNVYVEAKGQRAQVYSRPGVSTASNNLVGYGNGIFSDAGLSTATTSSDTNTVYTFVGNTFAKVYSAANVSGFVATETSTFTTTQALPYYYKGYYYLQYNSSIARRASLASTDRWSVQTTSAAIVVPSAKEYEIAFEHSGTMYLWQPSGKTGGGDNPFMAWTSDGVTYSSREMSSMLWFNTPSYGDKTNVLVMDNGYVFWYSQGNPPVWTLTPQATVSSSFTLNPNTALDPAFSTATLGIRGITTDGTVFYTAVNNSTYSVASQLPTETSSWFSSWTLRSSSAGFGATNISTTLVYYRNKFILFTNNASSEIWISDNFENWSLAGATITTLRNNYMNDAANGIVMVSTFLYSINQYTNSFVSTAATIGTLSNPNNVKIDMVYG